MWRPLLFQDLSAHFAEGDYYVDEVGLEVGVGLERGLIARAGEEGSVVFEERGDVGGVIEVACLEAEAAR